jgi:hypothetical protein
MFIPIILFIVATILIKWYRMSKARRAREVKSQNARIEQDRVWHRDDFEADWPETSELDSEREPRPPGEMLGSIRPPVELPSVRARYELP